MSDQQEHNDEFVEKFTERKLAFKALRKIRHIVDDMEAEEKRNRKKLTIFGVLLLIMVLALAIYLINRDPMVRVSKAYGAVVITAQIDSCQAGGSYKVDVALADGVVVPAEASCERLLSKGDVVDLHKRSNTQGGDSAYSLIAE